MSDNEVIETIVPNFKKDMEKRFSNFKRNPTKDNAQELGKAMVVYAKDYAKQY